MSQDNHITLRGYLTAEPTLYQKTPTATPITEIRIGSTPRRLNRETGEWYDAPASYFTVKCWRRLAINAASSLHKGDMVVVRGRVYMNHWIDRQQRQQSRMEIEADSLGHDLAYGWSRFLRGTRSQSDRADAVNAGELARQDVGSGDSGLRSVGDTDPGSGFGNGSGVGTVTGSTETGQGPDGYGAGLANHDASSAHDISSPYDAGSANSGTADDEYSSEGEYSAADGYSAVDRSAGTSATPDSSVVSITESDGDEALKSDDVLAASALTGVESLPEVEREVETVPF